jgi:hypothetical protein
MDERIYQKHWDCSINSSIIFHLDVRNLFWCITWRYTVLVIQYKALYWLVLCSSIQHLPSIFLKVKITFLFIRKDTLIAHHLCWCVSLLTIFCPYLLSCSCSYSYCKPFFKCRIARLCP